MEHNNNDWLISIMFTALLIAAVVGNYFIHGGHIQW